MRVGFDIGGTFTDFVLEDPEHGHLFLHKIPTTPADFTRAALAGLDELVAKGELQPGDIDTILHATTVASNAILERRGSHTVLITTRGFRDVLIIGRQKRYNTYDLYLDKPAPLIARRFIYEVDERIGHDGEVVRPLDLASVDRAISAIKESDAESAAVALLHSYANPSHEQAIGKRLRERLPELDVTLSSDVSPKYREYERTSTTVANAYVKPIVARYLDVLRHTLAERRLAGDMYIMQSNGGLVSPKLAREYPVRIIESGPAAGVLMCAAAGAAEGFDRVLTFDMGGTTAKLGAVDHGKPVITPTFEVDNKHFRKYSGLPLNVPAVELLEIGAGGGSLATTDMGIIRVGPQSAGAEPGPACYSRGADRPTVTDANVMLGYINPEYFNGGAMRLDTRAARAAIQTHIAGPLGIDAGAAAWGIHAVANSSMEAAMRVISVERGRDPRQYALIAFGGAGPLHAARLARALRIPAVVVPRGAGVGSALGLLSADSRVDVSITRIVRLEQGCHSTIAQIYEALAERALKEHEQLNPTQAPRWERCAYLRHAGQGFEVKVDLPAGEIDEGYAANIAEAFNAVYERTYGYRDANAMIEGVDWQLVARVSNGRGGRGSFTLSGKPGRGRDGPQKRAAYFPEVGDFVDCNIVDRYAMSPGQTLIGPAVVEEAEATTVVLPGDVVTLSAHGNLIISIAGATRQ
jgi:N-methylhydantoinase A